MRPEPLGPAHDARGFDCGVAAVNRGLRPAAGRPSETFVLAEGGSVLGFYTLSAGTVRSTAVPAWVLRGAPEPVLKLGRVAVDRRAQGRGLGTALVVDAFLRAYAISRHTPIAGLLTDPPTGLAGWLEGLGFRPVPGDTTAMLMPLGMIEVLVEEPK